MPSSGASFAKGAPTSLPTHVFASSSTYGAKGSAEM